MSTDEAEEDINRPTTESMYIQAINNQHFLEGKILAYRQFVDTDKLQDYDTWFGISVQKKGSV